MIAIEPRIEGSASARMWTVSFLDELVKITVNRLDDSSRSLWGEWTIKANFPGLPTPWMEIHHEGFNLLSSAKARLAKALTIQYPAIPWTTIVDKTAKMVIERHRAGEPANFLKDTPRDESLAYRLAPLLLENEPTLIYGLGGKGKSLLSQYLAVLVSEGFVTGSLEPEPGRVLICDYETNQITVDRHVRKIHAGLGIEDSSNILYRAWGSHWPQRLNPFSRKFWSKVSSWSSWTLPRLPWATAVPRAMNLSSSTSLRSATWESPP